MHETHGECEQHASADPKSVVVNAGFGNSAKPNALQTEVSKGSLRSMNCQGAMESGQTAGNDQCPCHWPGEKERNRTPVDIDCTSQRRWSVHASL